MIRIKKLFLLAALFCWSNLYAQTNPPVQMATGLRSSGKIYVVVAVVVIILAGLFAYVISIDRKIRKLEKNIEQNQEHKP